ncbi:MAG: SAM-dependent methyltransferase [Myxococcota bacterium]
METQFLFATCQVGTERILKEELAQRFPFLRPAFSRPGLITFKDSREGAAVAPDFELGAVFARAYGACLGEVVTSADDQAKVMAEKILSLEPKPVAQLWLRDVAAPGDEGDILEARAAEVARLTKELGAFGVQVSAMPAVGQLVFDIVVVEDASWWLGVHKHSIDHPPSPITPVHPPEAPSRAYLKVEEAIRWFGLSLREGDIAVELGSAPGGVVYALLARGLKVTGIDPGEMAPAVKANKRFTHLAMSAFDVRENNLPKRVDWLLLDMNTEPELGLRAVEHQIKLGRMPTYGVILTLKLNQPSFSTRIPELVNRVRSRGFPIVYAKQLTANRREITLVGLTDRGLRRA